MAAVAAAVAAALPRGACALSDDLAPSNDPPSRVSGAHVVGRRCPPNAVVYGDRDVGPPPGDPGLTTFPTPRHRRSKPAYVPPHLRNRPAGGDRGGDRGYDRRDDRRGGACTLHFFSRFFACSAAISRLVDVIALDRARGSTPTTPSGLESIKVHTRCRSGPRRGRSARARPRVDPRGKP